ncbi:MAG TPA: twin-arginine translocase subunit TatC [Gammaproteobacteria bacterium]|nr:twin-arginine translocase subunit TatC [Gammaproteobacteria bacterium]
MSKQPDNHEPEEEQLAEGTLISHLLELRSRLMKAVFAVLAVLLALTPFSRHVFEYVSEPLRSVVPDGRLIVTKVASPFLTPFKTTFFVALFIAMPYVLFQVWQFVAPGLYRREKRFAFPLIISSILLFYVGIAFAYFVVFRVMFTFFVKVLPGGVAMTPDIDAYLDFVLEMFLAFGLVFEVPIATLMLVWSGLVPLPTLAKIRPYVLLIAFVVGLFLAPDVFSQTLLAVPMYLLYEAGLLLARILLPEKTRVVEKEAET